MFTWNKSYPVLTRERIEVLVAAAVARYELAPTPELADALSVFYEMGEPE
jgi:hypothetical protein